MKMRKLLAVVLAVTMAISAMALSAFADTYTIPLYNYTSTNEYTVTYEITVPAYALYGYASQSDYLVLNLPRNLSATTTAETTTEEEVLDHYEKVSIYGTSTIISAEAYAELTAEEQAEYTAIESTTYNFDTVINYYELNDEAKEDGTLEEVITVDRYNAILAEDAENETDVASNYTAQTVQVLAGETINIEGYIKTVEAEVVSTVSIEDYDKLTDTEKEGYEEAYRTETTTTTATVPSNPDQVIEYYITVNGVTVELQGTNTMYGASWGENYTVDGSYYGTYSQVVEIGTFARDYTWAANSSQYFAMVPQSTMVSENTPVTITAVIDYSDYLDYSKSNYDPGTAESWEVLSTYWPEWSSPYGYNVSIEYYDADEVLVGKVLGTGMSVTKTYGSSSTADTVMIVADVTNDDGLETGKTLYWDHTLLNRANIMTAVNTEGTTAQVVVTLEDSITGYAVYTLRAAAESTSYGSSNSSDTSLWYTSGTSGLYNTVAGTYVLAGDTTTELVFDIDPSVLYNGTYGVYNGTFWVTQQITAGGTAISSYSDYATHTDYSNGTTYQLRATEVNLVITVPDEADATLEVNDPVEPGDTDTEDEGTEDITVNEPADVEPETNPTTGIVLALVPMAVAAAAAVASKRR